MQNIASGSHTYLFLSSLFPQIITLIPTLIPLSLQGTRLEELVQAMLDDLAPYTAEIVGARVADGASCSSVGYEASPCSGDSDSEGGSRASTSPTSGRTLSSQSDDGGSTAPAWSSDVVSAVVALMAFLNRLDVQVHYKCCTLSSLTPCEPHLICGPSHL